MILVNKNFGSPALSSVIGDMFKASSDVGSKVDFCSNSGALAASSSLVANLTNPYYSASISSTANDNYPTSAEAAAAAAAVTTPYNNYNANCNNFFIVTEQFIKTLDKVYTKIWNESFTETGIYTPSNLATLYYGFVADNSAGASSGFMSFKKFVDRCITAGILMEADRLNYKDQIFVSGMSRTNMSTQVDTVNKLITLTHSTPIDISPDIDTQTGQYLNGKKLYLMMTPYLTNESVIKGYNNIRQEPFANYYYAGYDTTNDLSGGYIVTLDTPVKRPISFFKPKTDASKYGRSLPLATHFFWSIGTPADKAAAIAAGKPIPDLIFDHLDRISHIDSLVLKIKYDKLQF